MRLLKFLMFNRLVRSYLNSNAWFLQWNKRAKSLLLELSYTLSVFFPFLVLLMIPIMIFGDSNPLNFELLDLFSLIPFNLMMIALVNKDFFNGQSVVHRLLGYQVVDAKTNLPANKVKCMLRNVTAPIWPIEGIFSLVYPKRRLGDFIAGTALIETPTSNPELILSEIKNATFDNQARLAILVSIIWIMIITILIDPRINFLFYH